MATVENFRQQGVRYWLGADEGLDRESKLTRGGADHARWLFNGDRSDDGSLIGGMIIQRPASRDPSGTTQDDALAQMQRWVNAFPDGDPGTPPGRRGRP